jgi:high-affinity nickel permease
VPLLFDQVPVFVLGMAIAWAFVQGHRLRIRFTLAWGASAVTIAWLAVGATAGLGVLQDVAASWVC